MLRPPQIRIYGYLASCLIEKGQKGDATLSDGKIFGEDGEKTEKLGPQHMVTGSNPR
jgi:hypothetical protein